MSNKNLVNKIPDNATLIITQTRSAIGVSKKQQKYLKSLGLKKIGSIIETKNCSATQGLLVKAGHLIKFSVK